MNRLNSVSSPGRRGMAVIGAVFFAYVLWIRIYDISTTFLMLGEQTRDWAVALGGLTELPLTGAPSTAGGRGLGPIYYWWLWIGRVTIGPFMDNLPHAGGVAVALLQSIADTWLFVVLSRRMAWPLALATSLLIASAPFDIALSSLIWNPPVAAALIKLAIATALSLDGIEAAGDNRRTHPWRVALAAAFAWMAVQTHLSGAFVAGPLLLALAWRGLFAPSGSNPTWRRRLTPALAIAATILVLQIPFLIALLRDPSGDAGPSAAIAGLANPQVFRPWFAFDSAVGIAGSLVLPMRDGFNYAIPTLVAMAIVAWVYRRDPILVAVTAGSMVMATLLFTTSTRAYDGYWFVTLTPAWTILIAMTIAAIPARAAVKWVGAAALIWAAWRQPARTEASTVYFKYPQYGTMVKASRDLIARAPVVRDIRLEFEVHPTMDRFFIYRTLGGLVDSHAMYVAVISGDGAVNLRIAE